MQRDGHEAIACWNEGEKWLANEEQVSVTFIEFKLRRERRIWIEEKTCSEVVSSLSLDSLFSQSNIPLEILLSLERDLTFY